MTERDRVVDPGFYRGWLIVGASFVTAMLATGGVTYSFGLFLVPITREFGLSRAEAANGLIALSVGSAVMAPIAGRLIDRLDVRVIMAVGGALLALGLVVVAQARAPWVVLLAIVGPIAFASDCAGGIAGTAVTARWFRRRRGRAIGIISVAVSAGGAVMAPVAGYLIQAFGWRRALMILGPAMGGLVIVAALAFIRPHPSEETLRAAGELDPVKAEAAAGERRLWSYGELLRSRNYLLIVLGTGLLLAGDRAILVSVPAYLADAGIGLQQAAFMVSAFTGAAVVGKLAIGLLAERFDIRRLYVGIAALHLLLLFCFLAHPSYGVLLAAAMSCGIGLGGVLPTSNLLMVANFGSGSYGTVAGLSGIFIQLLSVVSLRVIGAVRDGTGSYDAAFRIFMAVVVASTVMILLVRRSTPPAPSVATAEAMA